LLHSIRIGSVGAVGLDVDNDVVPLSPFQNHAVVLLDERHDLIVCVALRFAAAVGGVHARTVQGLGKLDGSGGITDPPGLSFGT